MNDSAAGTHETARPTPCLDGALEQLDEGIEYLYRIRCHYSALSKKQKKIAGYICQHQHEIMHTSISKLSEKIGVNAPALTRFAQALGFKGFSELKFYMEKDLLTPFSDRASVLRDDSIEIVKQKLIKQNQEIIEDTISTLSEAEIEKAIKAIEKCRRFCIFAEGGSTAAAVAAHNMFLQLGLSCEVYQDAFLGISVASQLQKGDVAMAISYSGSSINTVNFLKESKSKRATTIAITGYVNSHLTGSADIVLYTSTKVKNDLRDMHIARISEMCVIGMLQVGIYINMPDLAGNIQNLMEVTHMTRLKTGQNIYF